MNFFLEMIKVVSRNSYIPPYVKENLKWYERDGLITYIDQLKYNEFRKNRDKYINETKIVNFDIINNACRRNKMEKTIKEYNTISTDDLKTMPPSEKYCAASACFRSSNKNLIIDKTVAKEHFNCKNKNISRKEEERIKLKQKYFECW